MPGGIRLAVIINRRVMNLSRRTQRFVVISDAALAESPNVDAALDHRLATINLRGSDGRVVERIPVIVELSVSLKGHRAWLVNLRLVRHMERGGLTIHR